MATRLSSQPGNKHDMVHDKEKAYVHAFVSSDGRQTNNEHALDGTVKIHKKLHALNAVFKNYIYSNRMIFQQQ